MFFMFELVHNQTKSSGGSEAVAQTLAKEKPEARNHLNIQCKLTVGAPDDPLEHEADAMADRAMRMPEQNFIQRKCAHCEQEEKAQRKPLSEFIQRKESSGATVASDAMSRQLSSGRGGGNNMDAGTKNFMETRFGTDFSSVKIHTGGEAANMNRELNAHAFTLGNDIYFNEGKYQPASDSGKFLLAHELTHTIQQSGRIGRKIQRFTAGCRQLMANSVPSLQRVLSGTAVHYAIMADFATTVPGGINGIGIPGASAAPLRTAGLCGEDIPTIVPQIIGGRAGMGFPDLAARSGPILQVAEIKPASWNCAIDGTFQLAGYVTQGNAPDPQQVAWRAANGIISVVPMNPALYPSRTLVIGNYTVMTEWCAPGLLVYQVIGSSLPIPIPVPLPQPAERRVPALRRQPTAWEAIRTFAEEAIETGATGRDAIVNFLRQHPELIDLIIAVGIAGLIATFAEDIATLGAGILDDLITVPFFARMIAIAVELRQALTVTTAVTLTAGAR
jgi:hypothetical protein